MMKHKLMCMTATIALTVAGTAHAQTSSPSPADASPPQDIVVTGSRLPSADLVSSAPVTVLDRSEIEATGATSVGSLLRELPAATATSSESAGRGNSGSATVALRGLSAVNTLVLINGRRVLASNSGGTVDLNSIPFETIERVEVLQDGASAIYGSDAVAGVVNLIMRRSYDGLLIKGSQGISSRGDLPVTDLGLVFGQEFDRGGFVFSASYRHAGGNLIADRPISRDVDWRSSGGRNFRDPLPLRTSFTGLDPSDPSRALIVREGVSQATSLADFRDFRDPWYDAAGSAGSSDGLNYWDYESSASKLSNINLGFSGSYEITPNITGFVEAGYNRRKSLGFLAPDAFGEAYGDTIIVDANNDYNPFGVDLSATRTIGEQSRDDARQSRVRANMFRIVAGLEGDVHGWKWDLSYNYQALDSFTYGGKGVLRDRLEQAAGDSDICRALGNGCVPINLFGSERSITQDMLNFVSADIYTQADAKLNSVVGNVHGTLFNLPAGPVQIALGAEYRTESYSEDHDSNSEVNAFIFRVPLPDQNPPTRRVSEFYAEAAIPLLRDIPLIHSLDIEAAIRYSHYNAFGSTTNPKIGVKWRPFEDLLLRGSWGTGFRAPTFNEANSPQTRNFRSVSDPCQGSNYASLPGCNGVQAPTSVGAFVLSGGNPNLKPEDAETITLGAVFTPRFLRGLSVTVDVYRIDKHNIIGAPSVNYILAQNAANGSYADRVTRNSANAIVDVIATRDNLLDQRVQGIDLGIEYKTPESDWGQFIFRGDVTYLDSFKQSPAAGIAPIEKVGTYSEETGTLARWRGSGRIGWTRGDFGVNYAMRYVGSVTNLGSLLVNGENLRADGYVRHDLQFNFNLRPADARFTLGVENLFDRMPPYLEGNYANGFDTTTFDSRGRFFYARFEKKF